ncbi:hypothetical protein [Brevibacillus fulvus]|uniref:Uncharacterized protein n=1 Tax=Brevibacillus fulvus TaxID=1125967 RepID=A0A938XW42_9BACL|nr:hypothetical protein [Brevibacillus fulvus]MBM7588785.1 hypothetical protein [Brevibacillus fulvus]
MEDLLGKPVKTKDRPRKKGIIEYIDEQHIVVFWQVPRSERVIFSSLETMLEKVEVVDEDRTI